MKIRTLLLAACMVVVPLIAMFSHRVPPEARAAVGGFLRDVARGVGVARPAVLAPPVAAAPVRPAAVVDPPAEATRVVPVAAVVPPSESGSDSMERLRTLGAVAIDCRPLPGPGGHVASCRVAIDGAGQLERVFQATGASAAAAVDNLLRDVGAWRSGSAGEPPRTMRF